MFCYACTFDLVSLDLVFIQSVFVCYSLDHFDFVSLYHFSNLLLRVYFFSAEPRDWLVRTTPK